MRGWLAGGVTFGLVACVCTGPPASTAPREVAALDASVRWLADEVRVNVPTVEHQHHATVAATPDGGALVAYVSGDPSGGRHVWTRRLDAQGRPVPGGSHRVSDAVHSHPQVVQGRQGLELVLQWNEEPAIGHVVLDGEGGPQGEVTELARERRGKLAYPDAAVTSDGHLVSVWYALDAQERSRVVVDWDGGAHRDAIELGEGPRGGPLAVDTVGADALVAFARFQAGRRDLFLARATPEGVQGRPLKVVEGPEGTELMRPDLAVGDEVVAFAWMDEKRQEAWLRFLDVQGSAKGPPLRLDRRRAIAPAVEAAGDVLAVTWQAEVPGDRDVMLQLWDLSRGEPLTAPQRVQSGRGGRAERPDVALLPDGDGVRGFVTWEAWGEDEDGRSVHARSFTWSPAPG